MGCPDRVDMGNSRYRDGNLVTSSGVLVMDYAIAFAHEGIGIPGQPKPQYYFH